MLSCPNRNLLTLIGLSTTWLFANGNSDEKPTRSDQIIRLNKAQIKRQQAEEKLKQVQTRKQKLDQSAEQKSPGSDVTPQVSNTKVSSELDEAKSELGDAQAEEVKAAAAVKSKYEILADYEKKKQTNEVRVRTRDELSGQVRQAKDDLESLSAKEGQISDKLVLKPDDSGLKQALEDTQNAKAAIQEKLKDLEAKLDEADKQATESGKKLEAATELKNQALNLELPRWLSLHVVTGTQDLFKTKTGDSGSKLNGLLFEGGMNNPQRRKPSTGEPRKCYWLLGGRMGLLSADPRIQNTTPQGVDTSSASSTFSQTAIEQKGFIELDFRAMHWIPTGFNTSAKPEEQELALGIYASAVRSSYDSVTRDFAPDAAGKQTIKDHPSVNIQATQWKAALRVEYTPNGTSPYRGTYYQLGWMRNPMFMARQDRFFHELRIAFGSPSIFGKPSDEHPSIRDHIIFNLRHVTGYGQRDEVSAFIGYVANFSKLTEGWF